MEENTSRLPNGGSAVVQRPGTKRGIFIGRKTVPTLKIRFLKILGITNIALGILLIILGIAIIAVRAGNYNAGGGIWAGACAVCCGILALTSQNMRRCVVIYCLVLAAVTIVVAFAAAIIAGTGIRIDQSERPSGVGLALNAVFIVVAALAFVSAIVIVFFCAKGLNDVALARDVDTSQMYPSMGVARGPEGGIANPSYVEEVSKSSVNGSIRLLNPKQPILLLPLKERQMDTVSISYDLSLGHTQTCKIMRYNDSLPSDLGSKGRSSSDNTLCRENIVHVEVAPERSALCRSANSSTSNLRGGKSEGGGNEFIVLDTVDAEYKYVESSTDDVCGVQENPKTGSGIERRLSGEQDHHGSLTHWDTMESLNRDPPRETDEQARRHQEVGDTPMVVVTPPDGTTVCANFSETNGNNNVPVSKPISEDRPNHSQTLKKDSKEPPNSQNPDDTEIRTFAKKYIDQICQDALDQANAEYARELAAEGSESGQSDSGSSEGKGSSGGLDVSSSDSDEIEIKERLFQHLTAK